MRTKIFIGRLNDELSTHWKNLLYNITNGFVAKYLINISHMCTTKNYQVFVITIRYF